MNSERQHSLTERGRGRERARERERERDSERERERLGERERERILFKFIKPLPANDYPGSSLTKHTSRLNNL